MRKVLIYLCCVVFASTSLASAQDQPRTEAQGKANSATTPIKFQVVFEEFEGPKKTKSLPYALYHNTTHGSVLEADFTRFRLNGSARASNGQALQIATKLDLRAVRNDDGRFLVQLNLDRSWADFDSSTAPEASSAEHQAASADASKAPVVRNVSCDLYLSMRDGQTLETFAATEPTTGRIIRVEVTLNVLK